MAPTPLTNLTAFLYQKIPLTRAMEVSVEECDVGKLTLTAPLEANHNHLGTAFGGSLAALATLAGYSMLWLKLGDSNTHIVIRSSTIDYRRPVRGTLRAICRTPDNLLLDEFESAYLKKGKARIQLQVTIEEDDHVCVDFTGEFVALRSCDTLGASLPKHHDA